MIDSLKQVLTTAQGEARIDVLNRLCWEYRTSDQNRAIEYGLQALGLAEQLQSKRGMASALNNLGIVYRRRGNHPQALDYHLKALKISEEIKDSNDIGKALNRIGLVYQGQGNFAAALEYFQRSRDIYEKIRIPQGIANAMTNIGEIYSRQGSYSLALEYLVKSQAIHQEIEDLDGVAETSLEIGLVYGKQGNVLLALDYFQKALRTYEQIGNRSGIAQTLSAIGAAHLQRGNLKQAEEFAMRSYKYAQEIGEIEWIKQSSKTLAQVFAAKKNFRKALEYELTYSRLKDSTTGEESVRKIADLEAMLASEKRQAQIEILTKENQIQQIIRNSLALGLLLVFIIAYILFRSNHQQKKANQLLSQQNEEILRQQKLLEEQASEIELANTELQEANLNLKRQQQVLEEQTREIELANSELLELNINLERKQAMLEEQSRQIEQANNELQMRNAQLKDINDQMNEFLGIAAHDLKNPLTSIVMTTSAIRRYYDRMTKEEILENLRNLESTAERMRMIIHNLLEINKIETGNLHIASEPVLPGTVAEKLVEEWKPKAAAKDITLVFDNRAPNKFFIGDASIFYQILENLLSNAIKYSPHGKTVWVRILASEVSGISGISQQGVQEYIRVEVQDEGPGLSAEDKAKLFEKFARLSAQPTGGEHSTGLGLSIVKKLVEAMNGRVWCESKLGKGATFIVEMHAASV
ncbi:MAG: tetratricopeptide repeat protein [Bacteroidota bacterium]|nr:tetratricopeptide repeat protein [Candidatus Kapabacteria bacterium]MDW8220364.1 tetratricopeptide repeat protein [Bacteroidota bacterium]